METPPASPAQPLTSKLSKALSTTWTLLSSITAGLRSIFRNRAVQLWHSSARWKWLELLVIGLFATAIAVDEYIAAVVFAFLAALGALSRLLHSEIRVTWKVLGSVGVVVLLLYLTAISTAKIGEKPISNLIILRDRFITIQQLPRNKMPDILRRAPTPDWASRQHSDTHIDLPPSVPPFKDTLVINALAGNGNYVEGSRIGTIDPITWKSYYSEVTVIFVNTSPEDYDAFDVSVDPDQVIFGASQVTAVPGVSIFSPSGGPGTQLPPEQIGPLPPGRVLLLPNNVHLEECAAKNSPANCQCG